MWKMDSVRPGLRLLPLVSDDRAPPRVGKREKGRVWRMRPRTGAAHWEGPDQCSAGDEVGATVRDERPL
jgi:hypothetical protein